MTEPLHPRTLVRDALREHLAERLPDVTMRRSAVGRIRPSEYPAATVTIPAEDVSTVGSNRDRMRGVVRTMTVMVVLATVDDDAEPALDALAARIEAAMQDRDAIRERVPFVTSVEVGGIAVEVDENDGDDAGDGAEIGFVALRYAVECRGREA